MSGFIGRLLSQWIEVIEWLDPTSDTLVYRFPVNNQEIKMGAQLTVREGQAAIFVNEGQIADVFQPGRYELSTQNMPILTMFKSWKYGFNSPFKAEVYFVSTRQFTDQKWGTSNPIMMRDAEFGVVRLRAFGNYSFRVTDPQKFMKEVVGTQGLFQTEEIGGQLRSLVVTQFTDALAELKVAALDLAQNYIELSGKLQEKLAGDFDAYGLAVTKFLIENISLPPEVEAMLDKRTSMGIVGDMSKYAQFQAAQAIEAAANNPGGGGEMTAGLGMGAGLAMGQQMADTLRGSTGQAAAPAQKSVKDRLGELKGLLDDGLIGEDDYNARKAQILADV